MNNFLKQNNLLSLHIFDIVLTEYGFNIILRSPLYEDKAIFILIGFAEAHLLTIQFNKVKTSKPIIMDTIMSIFKMIQVKPKCTVIYDLREGYFFSRIYLETQDKKRYAVEAKASDTIALIIAGEGKIFIEKTIFDSAAQPYNFYEDKWEEETQQYKKIKLKTLKSQLQKAVTEERYEDAASLRDEIRALEENGNV